MSYISKVDTDFMHYLASAVDLDELNRMTEDLSELKNAQQMMNQIKGMIESLPRNVQDLKQGPNNSCFQREDPSNFLNNSAPNLLKPDNMVKKTCDVDVDAIIAKMKSYTEDIEKKLVLSDIKTKVHVNKVLEDFEQHAPDLDVICQSLSNLKLNKKDESSCNHELNTKL